MSTTECSECVILFQKITTKVENSGMQLFFALLLVVRAFEAGQSKSAFPNRSDSDRRITVDDQHPRSSDYPNSDGPEVSGYSAVDDPDEVNDEEVDFAPSDHPKGKRWVPTEVSVDQVMHKVLLSRLVNNKDRQGKRGQSGSFRPSSDDDGSTPNKEPFPPVSLLRREEGRLFTGELEPEPNRFVYKTNAGERCVDSPSDVQRQNRVKETTSMTGKRHLAQKHRGDISKRKILERPNNQRKHLPDIFVASDYLDRQRARESRRHRQKNRQESLGQEEQEERLILHPSLYGLAP